MKKDGIQREEWKPKKAMSPEKGTYYFFIVPGINNHHHLFPSALPKIMKSWLILSIAAALKPVTDPKRRGHPGSLQDKTG